jgi:hypothetical protein
VHVFISYRRSDSQAAARQLAEALKLHFGEDAVFFDTDDLRAGDEWQRRIEGRLRASDVVVAVMGPRWAITAKERARRLGLEPDEQDVLRLEIETALLQRIRVVPVLVDDGEMPSPDTLPRPFRPLAGLQAQVLRHASWDEDVERLLREIDTAPPPPPAPPARAAVDVEEGSPACEVAGRLMDAALVTVVGSGIHDADRSAPWKEGDGTYPNARELAGYLTTRFRMRENGEDLAHVSQRVALTKSRLELHHALRDLLGTPALEPGLVSRFLAGLPGRLRAIGSPSGQLIVTANYDRALEQAFDAVREPYDLVVFAASGDHAGRFVHLPWWDPEAPDATPILVPNEYDRLPVFDDGTLERTVILKIHGGAADLGPGPVRLEDNFVITEDDYIGYLTQGPIGTLVPHQILAKLRESHFLFLGYRLRDWSLRVFLQRIWAESHDGLAWAADVKPDPIDKAGWRRTQTEFVPEALPDLLMEVEAELERMASAGLAP